MTSSFCCARCACQRFGVRLGQIQVGLRRDVLFGQFGGALKFLIRVLELRLGFRQRGLGRSQLRLGHVQAGLDVGIIQPRQDLAVGDLHAFLDEHFRDLAGDFGGNRRLAPRGDVTGGVQHSPVTTVAACGIARHRGAAPRRHSIRNATKKPQPPTTKPPAKQPPTQCWTAVFAPRPVRSANHQVVAWIGSCKYSLASKRVLPSRSSHALKRNCRLLCDERSGAGGTLPKLTNLNLAAKNGWKFRSRLGPPAFLRRF